MFYKIGYQIMMRLKEGIMLMKELDYNVIDNLNTLKVSTFIQSTIKCKYPIRYDCVVLFKGLYQKIRGCYICRNE